MKKISFLKNIAVVTVTAIIAMFVGSKIPYLIDQWKGPFKKGDYSAHVYQKPNKLTLYGTTTCPHCISVRKYLYQAGIPFNDQVIDQSKNAAVAFKQLKQAGVPVLISADRLVAGFDQDAYSELNNIVNK